MDPRIRERRIAVLRAQGRNRLRVLLVLLGLLVIIVGGWGLTRTSLLAVDRILVQGVRGVDQAEALQASGLQKGLAMTDLKPAEVAEAIEVLPWVSSAEVRRNWPKTVHVHVESRVPVAVVPAHDDSVVLIDKEGYAVTRRLRSDSMVLDSSTKGSVDTVDPFIFGDSYRALSVDELPLIEVVFDGELGRVHNAALPGLSVVAALTDDLRPWVDSITVKPDGEVGLVLTGGANVIFSGPELLDDKIAALRVSLAAVDLTCITTYDITMADHVQVKRHPMCPTV